MHPLTIASLMRLLVAFSGTGSEDTNTNLLIIGPAINRINNIYNDENINITDIFPKIFKDLLMKVPKYFLSLNSNIY